MIGNKRLLRQAGPRLNTEFTPDGIAKLPEASRNRRLLPLTG